MNAIEKFIEFLLPTKRTFSAKTSFIIVILFFIVVVDNSIGLSYYYKTRNEIEILDKLNQLVSKPDTDSVGKVIAIKLRNELNERKTYFQTVTAWFKEQNEIKPQTLNEKPNQIEISTCYGIWGNVWFWLTSSGVYFLFALVVIPATIFTDKGTLSQRLVETASLVFIFLLVAGVLYGICRMIPLVSKQICWPNYIVNTIIQIASMIGLMAFSKMQKK